MSVLKTLSESTTTKKEEPHSKDIEQRLALVLQEHRKGLTYYEQAKSIMRALPEYGLRIQES